MLLLWYNIILFLLFWFDHWRYFWNCLFHFKIEMSVFQKRLLLLFYAFHKFQISLPSSTLFSNYSMESLGLFFELYLSQQYILVCLSLIFICLLSYGTLITLFSFTKCYFSLFHFTLQFLLLLRYCNWHQNHYN